MSDRHTHRRIADDLILALEPLTKKYPGVFKIKSSTYDPQAGDVFRVEFAPKSGELVLDRDAVLFQQLGPLVGFKPEDLGRVVVLDGTERRILGYRPGRKHSILIERVSDGRRSFYQLDAVLRACGYRTASEPRPFQPRVAS